MGTKTYKQPQRWGQALAVFALLGVVYLVMVSVQLWECEKYTTWHPYRHCQRNWNGSVCQF